MDNTINIEDRCGCFQITFVFLTQLARFATVWGLYIMMFGNYEPPWKCIPETRPIKQNNTSNSSHIFLDSINYYGSQSNNVDQSNNSLSVEGISVSNYSSAFSQVSSCNVYPSCQHVQFETDSLSIVSEFALICDRAWIAPLILSIELCAVVPGSYIGGQIGERFGRKVSLYGSTALLSASTGLAIFSTSWEMYTVFGFFIGLGSGGIMSTSVVYSMEFLSPWWRAMFASVPVWNASLAIFTLVIVLLRDWRYIHLASSCMSGLAFLGVFWVPESVRWLEVHGKRKEAIEVVKKIYRTNRRDIPSALTALEETTDLSEKHCRADTKHKTYLDLFRDSYTRSITIKAAIAWLCTVIAYLAMGYGVKALAGDFYVNVVISSVSEVPMMFTIGPLANKIGRRWSAMSFLCLAALACGLIVIVHFLIEGDTKGFTIKILALIAKAFAAAAWCALATMSVELFPTVVRNLGYGFLTLVSRCGGIIAPYLIPKDPSMFAICFSVMTGILIVSIVMAMSLPETKDKPLIDNLLEAQKIKSDETEDV